MEKQLVHTGLETNTVAKSHLGKPAKLSSKGGSQWGVRRVLPGEVNDCIKQDRVKQCNTKGRQDPNTSQLGGVRLG